MVTLLVDTVGQYPAPKRVSQPAIHRLLTGSVYAALSGRASGFWRRRIQVKNPREFWPHGWKSVRVMASTTKGGAAILLIFPRLSSVVLHA